MKRLWYYLTVAILLYTPFQGFIKQNFDVPSQFFWVDEIFILLSSTIVFGWTIYRYGITRRSLSIIGVFALFFVSGSVSGIYNSNPSVVTIHGIFDYLKNFLVIPVFCGLSYDEARMKRLYVLLFRLALFLCAIAVVQEAAFLLKMPLRPFGVHFVDMRFGFMRTPSLMGHPNVFGLFVLIFFIFDFSLTKKLRWQSLLLGLGAVLSISRMVWVALFLILFFFAVMRRWRKTIALFLLALAVFLFVIPDFYSRTASEISGGPSFREYVLTKSLSIWRDHPVLGSGPGMYGGVVSFTFDSPLYEKYSFSRQWHDVVRDILSLDQFWPQILVEMGIIGAFIFLGMLAIFWHHAVVGSRAAGSPFRRDIFFGCACIPVTLGVYLFGSGLNLTAVLLTYAVLFGMALGARDEDTAG